ncbi:MAG: 1-acyl-sn-glycerol-3-phosphate acyltransferase [Planctomycetia bacterium]|nr:1-acyl-sn-glycerol-3-phosphate acyltransferase [Planctomycetia bacterium]
MDSAALIAFFIFVALASMLEIWLIVAWRKTHYTFWQAFLYLVNTCFTRVLWRTQVSRWLPVTEDQGAVIVSNHRSGVDPLVIQLCTDRVVHWMVAREYFEMPGISVVFKTLASIPVNRGGIDTAATKMAIRLAQQGGLVGLFPEGRVNLTDELLLPGRPGAALIALKARVPVIPCYVEGAPYDGTALGSFFMTGKARVIIGKPIDLSDYYGREGDKAVLPELTKRFLVEIAKLAGVNDFDAKLAGKNWKAGSENGNGENASDSVVATISEVPVRE